MSPETYVGYQELQYLAQPVTRTAGRTTSSAPSLPLGGLGLRGRGPTRRGGDGRRRTPSSSSASRPTTSTWCMGGSGHGRGLVDGTHDQTVAVSGVPRLYTLFQSGHRPTGDLPLTLSPGVQAYDFTFG